GTTSRLYAAKRALSDVIDGASGDIDFGLMRYAPAAIAMNSGQNGTNCCNLATPECAFNFDYVNNNRRLTWVGDCGPVANGVATNGGQILVTPGTGSGARSATWVDGVEDFRDNGMGVVRNGELRANGSTPLAGSARTALTGWYQPILNFTRSNPNCNPAQNALCDPQIDCRPYVLVMSTDGADTCDSDAINAPPNAVR